MTSDMAMKGEVSEAQRLLNHCLGLEKVSMSQLTQQELIEVLKVVLREVDQRELRGFVELQHLFTQTILPQWALIHVLSERDLNFLSGAEIRHDFVMRQNVGSPQLGSKSHVAPLSEHGALLYEVTYRRHETGEETTDPEVASSWQSPNRPRKAQCWVPKITKNMLVLHRSNDRALAKDSLFRLDLVYEKITHEDRMRLTSVWVVHVPLESFHQAFGEHSAVAGYEMIACVDRLMCDTFKDLESQAAHFRTKCAMVESLKKSLRR